MVFSIGNSALGHSPLLFEKSGQGSPPRQPTSSPVPQATNEKPADINESIKQHRENSLVFQLMAAIARVNSGESNDAEFVPANEETSSNALDGFTLSVEYAQQESFFADIEFFNTGDSSGFSFDFETSFSETFEFTLTDPLSGTEISVTISRQSHFSFSASAQTLEPEQADPLILNLDNSDFNFDPSQKIQFDLDADGNIDNIDRLQNGNAFLALDINENGVIDDGSELFGDANGAKDGFQELSRYDDDNNGQINASDRIFENLMLLHFDTGGNQVLSHLSTHDIDSLSLLSEIRSTPYGENNRLIAESNFQRRDGSLGRLGDFLLSTV
ncbi:hypothetical protein [Aliikangiella coralliicola]|uniref:VCBS repeat-containing protein n=1 Tax=Aliikangiella coralliicola TaxID=2592383 RepID=A0A545U8K0_9GAMM|nr:hypothetical protein [Aliikangiella coralliicola]TQV85788.1 hypothetical protein FLL46_17845 [Aliikangiella coralliicola]